ncbi:MAG: FlgO family outer membrane protein [Chthoniobacterales bacterium]
MAQRSFFAELKRRNVYKVAVAYLVAAWALAQGFAQVLPVFDIPNWTVRLLVVLLILGFPVALVLSWAFEITPEGIKRTEDVDPAHATGAGRKLIAITVLLALCAASLLTYRLVKPTAVETQNSSMAVREKSIAVLPFDNVSKDEDSTSFADGVQDQILTDLAKVSDLKVISHTSVRQYKTGTQRNLREIGRQLGVAYIVEGSVQRSRDRVRINAELIDAATDTHVWAETYDRSAADLFAIQSDLAQAIAAQLQTRLSPQEKALIEERPTHDLVAYELYLRAKETVDSYLNVVDVRASLLEALQSLDQATKRDENFVSAYCYAARANGLLYFFDLDPTPARVLLAEAAANAALRLRPDSPEAHFAMGDFYFRCRHDYDRALQELATASPGLPNSTPFFILHGYINRRRNHWDVAERDFSHAIELDPRNPNAYNLLADTYVLERRFPDAIKVYDRAFASGEEKPLLRFRKESARFSMTGDSTSFRALLAAEPEIDYAGGQTPVRLMFALVDGNYTEANRVLDASPREDFQDIDFSFYFPKSWFRAMLARSKGDAAEATAQFEKTRAILEQRLASKPEHARTIGVLAMVDANLGRKDVALREAQHAMELTARTQDGYDDTIVRENLAQVYLWSGDRDKAIELLRQLVAAPSYINYGRLKLHPMWDPLRGDPRFEQILAELAPR